MRAADPSEEQQAAGPTGIMDRTFAVLELLAANPHGLLISAIAERLAIPLSASHRLLNDLAQRGYVRQERGYGAYQPTTKMVTLAFTYLAASGITDIAQPILDRLAAATGELVRLTVLDGDRLTWVAKAQGAQSGLRYDPETGNEVRLSCSSAGIAWLASMPDGEALARVAKQGFARREAFGPKAPQTASALLQHLRATRRRGYSVTVHTFTPWMSAMAAVVRHGAAGDVRGTVSIAGPSFRLGEARMHELGPQLLAAAAELSGVSVASPALASPALGRAHGRLDMFDGSP
jgi:IclR family transcriptional regulator, acetate operon repressor